MSTQLFKKDDDPIKNVQIIPTPLPPGYVCFRCDRPGHHIKNCPTKLSLHIKRSTGIPRSFMVPVDGPSHKGALLTSKGNYAVPLIQYQAYKEETGEISPPVKQENPVIESVVEKPKKLLGKKSYNYSHEKGNYYTRSDSQLGGRSLALPSTPVSSQHQSNAIKTLASKHGPTKNDVPPYREDPALRQQEYNVTPIEEVSLFQNQEYEVPPHVEVPLLQHQEHYQEYNVTHHENGSLLQQQNNYKEYDVSPQEVQQQQHYQEYDVQSHEKDSLLQHQEHYQQYNMPPHGQVPLHQVGYQDYNVQPSEKDYFLQNQGHYQSPPLQQLSIHPSIPDSIYGPPVLSQHSHLSNTSQMFPIQYQPPATFSIDNYQLPPSAISTNDVSVFKSLPYENEEVVTDRDDNNGSTLLDELQKKLDKLYRKYAKGRVNRSRSKSIEKQVSQSRSYSSSKSWTRAVSRSPTRISHQQDKSRSRSRSRSSDRSYSKSRYRTRTESTSHRSRNESGDRYQSASSENIRSLDPDQKDASRFYSPSRSESREKSYSRSKYRIESRSHSRSRNESGDRRQSATRKNFHSLDPDQQDLSRLYSQSRSGSRKHSYSQSKYCIRSGSRSPSRSRNESGGRHQSASSENIRSPRHRTHSRTFSPEPFRASSHRSQPYTSKHNSNHHAQFGSGPSYQSRFRPC